MEKIKKKTKINLKNTGQTGFENWDPGNEKKQLFLEFQIDNVEKVT